MSLKFARGLKTSAQGLAMRILGRPPNRVEFEVLAERTRLAEQRVEALEDLVLLSTAGHVETAADLLRPTPCGHDLRRIGSSGDGGYVIAGDLSVPRVAVSIGVGPECSADEDVAALGVMVHQFDHTVEQSPAIHPSIHFHRLGLGGGLPETRPLQGLLDYAGIAGNDSGWLLLDAEGAEWPMLLDVQAPLQAFDQCVIEFHRLSWLGDPHAGAPMLEGLRRLRSTHTPIWWNPNNFAPALRLQGRVVPDVLEVTFVRNESFKSGSAATPQSLGRPNNPRGPRLPEPFSAAVRNPYGPLEL